MKRVTSVAFLLSIFYVVLIAHAQAQTCAPAPGGIVAWWQGESNALDSRFGNNGTLQNGTTFGTGRVGLAFSFDGVDDFVDVPDSVSLDTVITTATFEAWINPEAMVAPREFVFSRRDPGAFESFSVEILPGGEMDLILGTTVEGTVVLRTPAGGIQFDGQWKHIAFTVNTTTNTKKAYINGQEVVLAPLIGSNISGQLKNVFGLFLGRRESNQSIYKGLLDEPTYYSAELSQAQIQAIFNAGLEGKCILPSNLVGWWPGDGNANDIAGTDNGTLQNGAGFAIDKVGQGFNFNSGQFVQIPDSPSNSITDQISIEGWIKPRTLPTTTAILSKYDSAASQLSYFFGMQDDELELAVYGNGDGSLRRIVDTTSANISTTEFTHVAATFDPTGQIMKIYVNGVEAPTTLNPTSTNVNSIFDSTSPVRIGAVAGNDLLFNGLIDEASLYSRALTAAEIQSIFNAGVAGKLKRVNTPTGSNAAVVPKSDSTITFPSITTAGSIQQIPLDPANLPSLPLAGTGLAYDISTNAVFTGSPTVCFNLPSMTDAVAFSKLRILHFESGWQDRTDLASINFGTRTICTTGISSFSPFAIASSQLTAASVSVSGRVITREGRGITNAAVSLIDAAGDRRSVRTGRLGYYRFSEVEAGQTVTLSVASRRFFFANPTRVINVVDEMTDQDFVGGTAGARCCQRETRDATTSVIEKVFSRK